MAADAQVEPLTHNVSLLPISHGPGDVPTFSLGLDEGQAEGYVRVEVRDASGKLLLLGNPIYFTRATSP